jgi:predicted RecB family nuclease
MGEHLLTPSKVSAWLECPHYLTLQSRVEDDSLTVPKSVFGSFAELVMAKGREHEDACFADYDSDGRSILTVESRGGRSFEQWVADIGNPFTGEYDVVYQMPFIHDGMRGIADFVVKVCDPDTGDVRYEPVDAKLVRTEAKPGHVLQLCFYADAIKALTGIDPEDMYIWLASGDIETFRADDFRPYWRRLRSRLAVSLAAGPQADTIAIPCAHCDYCEFRTICEEQWHEEDSLVYVAGIRRPEIEYLGAAEVITLTDLSNLDWAAESIDGIRTERLKRLSQQAALQRVALEQDELPFSIAESEDDETRWGLGLERLPCPDDGDVFIDFEGHPMWRPEVGLFFLFGLLERNRNEQWEFRAWWAHDKPSETSAAAKLIAYIAERRGQFSGMHAYHYNHTERSELQRLADGHAEAEAQLKELIDTGAFVDLYEVGLNGIQIGAESYGLKCMEKLTDFRRNHEIDKGAGAVLKYDHYMKHKDPADLAAIADYNEDDVRATQALRDWLVVNRPPETAWRAAYIEPEEDSRELDEIVVQLHARGGDAYFLGDLLGYWSREKRAYLGPKIAKLTGDVEDQITDSEIIGELIWQGECDRFHKKTGKPINPGMRFSFPAQELDKFPRSDGSVLFIAEEQKIASTGIVRLDRDANELELVWTEKLRESAPIPNAVAHYEWVEAKPKPEALQDFAQEFLDGTSADTVTMSLLRRDLPRFAGTAGLNDDPFTADLNDLADRIAGLDRSFLAIQGPPGTGKTYTAAHLVHALVLRGKRVGITATSHPAINNVLDQVMKVFKANGDTESLKAVRQKGGSAGLPAEVKEAIKLGSNSICGDPEFKLVAGTTWVFASQEMRDSPVDILIVDEAGQMSLADTLAASLSAHNLLLVGDPLQLPQVTQASHPDLSGRSVLEHILGDEVTMPPTRGVFLKESRRMHPDVCDFISEQIYEGKLSSYEACRHQTTVAGTGLRWIPADHKGNTTSSTEEVDLVVAEILRLVGTDWVNEKRVTRPLGPKDFVIVTPYNDQRRLFRERLEACAETAGVEVGTVDKFQGQEAAVVFFSMATSSGEDVVHGKDFLFSRNRLNVAVSRARCLAYLVCTEELLNTPARSVDEMRLIATLNAFVEWAAAGALN